MTPTIFVIGAPGSGKGTLCKLLSEPNPQNFRHISIGDILRAHISSPQASTETIGFVKRGELLPVHSLGEILKSSLDSEHGNTESKFVLLDGFPRRLDQAAVIEEMIGHPILVLFFHCPQQEAERRFVTRKLPGRENEDIELFRKRYAEFDRLNPDIVRYYQSQGMLLQIDTSRETETSYGLLIEALKERDEMRGYM